MSIEQNKAVVRRFVSEVLVGGHVDLVDDLLAASYVNRAMGDMDRAAFKAWLTVASAGPGGRMEIEDLVAEGDAVVARFTYAITLPSGETVTARGPHLLPSRRWQDRGGRPNHHARSDPGVRCADAAAPFLTTTAGPAPLQRPAVCWGRTSGHPGQRSCHAKATCQAVPMAADPTRATCIPWTECPGCGLRLPDRGDLDPRTHASAACRMLYGEVQGYELDHLAELGRHHQVLVDVYGAQHIGPATPGIRSAFCLIGLELSLVGVDQDCHSGRAPAAGRTLPNVAGLRPADVQGRSHRVRCGRCRDSRRVRARPAPLGGGGVGDMGDQPRTGSETHRRASAVPRSITPFVGRHEALIVSRAVVVAAPRCGSWLIYDRRRDSRRSGRQYTSRSCRTSNGSSSSAFAVSSAGSFPRPPRRSPTASRQSRSTADRCWVRCPKDGLEPVSVQWQLPRCTPWCHHRLPAHEGQPAHPVADPVATSARRGARNRPPRGTDRPDRRLGSLRPIRSWCRPQ